MTGHVTFPAVGRMGNFCFELATCISYALKHDMKFTVPFHTTNEYWSPIYFKSLQDRSFDPHKETITLYENQFNYEPLEFREEWRNKNIVIVGYRQSEKYFAEHRNEILYLLNLHWELKPVISIHARFGDYLTVRNAHGQMKHIVVDNEYLTKAIALMKERIGIERFKVFSDDLALFRQRHGHLYDFEYSTNTNEFDDMVEISCCHSNIGSLSTFSWWGAWLNRNNDKVVVCQQGWFTPNWDGLDTKNIVPENWIRI